ncbi:uncharacterized protein A1O9_08965 [Exophiala aquamarina CBS 119918]|uniref:Beta-fructofuranosidase n=1 Tax=Exophiala aquamarina CBS 119918 TaxID=1182545 RepID=A0A072P660_9EURO|nr:uncharacterized protein A1O9_08965 [Exophiala aquamarina CBS 119918]KEF55311.1 hypothetical protein A1O9_08965 [Exophiala aquamarina CBS 119918]
MDNIAVRTLSFQAPGSLAETLAAHETRKTPTDGTSPVSDAQGDENVTTERPGSRTVYDISLPSLHFLRWRPLYHLQAPSGWMNDPCGPGYDASTGLYHMFFQWNPRRNSSGSVVWGTVRWGHATSKDMLNWTVSGTSTIKPGSWFDKEGCFTGCFVPTGLRGEPGQLTVFYTGVSRLPLHYTIPYVRQTETLAVATSADGGQSWTKIPGNPILPEPPEGLAITGWRDPFVARWRSMDAILGRDKDSGALYGLISGGLRDHGPTAFLYAIDPTNLKQWTYLNAIVDIGMNHNISRWSGDLGINWECACFMTLRDDKKETSREFVVVGGEGSDTSHPESTFAAYPQESTTFPRWERSLQWMCGTLGTRTNAAGQSVPKMEYSFGGRFDHGMMYAVNIFRDPLTSNQLAWGWITEEDLPQKLVDRQNWSGMLGLPRELSLTTLRGVTGAFKSKLKEITSIEATPDVQNTFTVRTLGISPASCLQGLRKDTRQVVIQGSPDLTPRGECFMDVQTCRFELTALMEVSSKCSRIGVSIFHTEDHEMASRTMVYLMPVIETLKVERPHSSEIDPGILTFPETAPFTLFSFQEQGGQSRELFELRLFFDESVLEIFANSRCTIATRVYPASKRCWGIRFWAEDESEQSRLVHAQAWDGIRADIHVE